MPLKKSQRSLKKWTGQDWTTPSGKKSSETGEVYAPKAQINKFLRCKYICNKIDFTIIKSSNNIY